MEPLLSGLSTFFSWLMDYTIDISILICMIFIIKSIAAKKLPAWWHYSLWIILLLRMIIPFKFENSLKIPNVMPISIDESLFKSVLIEEEFITAHFTTELSSSTQQGWNIQVNDIMVILWLTFAFIFAIYILVKNIKFRNTINKEPLLTDNKVLDLLEECKSRMKIRTPLKITITGKVKSPALFGYIRPRLLLPAGVLEKLDEAELSYIFMHELGHLKRHDIGVSWIITFLHIFQWFNPFVWLAFYQMRIDQESACDASVLSRIKHNQTIDYASTIVGFLENFCRNRKLPAMVGILENQTQIKRRITMIVSYRKYSKTMMFFSTTMLIIIGFIFFSLAGFAKTKHEGTGLDPSIMPLPLGISNDLATQDNVVMYEKEVVKFTEEAQKSYIVSQERVDKDMTEQEDQNLHSQRVLPEVQDNNIKDEKESVRVIKEAQKSYIVSQERVDKDKVEQPTKQNPQSQKVLAEIQDNNISDKVGAVGHTAVTKKKPAEVLKVFREVYNISSEKNDILKQAYETGQAVEAASLSGRSSNTSEAKRMNYPGLASPAYYRSDNPKETLVLPEIKPDDRKTHSLKEVDEPPKIVSYYPLIYPFKAKAKGIEGRVILRFIVDSAGHVQNLKVVSAKPEGVFEQAALDTVMKYKIRPAMKDGKGVSSVVNLPISFDISDNYLKFAQK